MSSTTADLLGTIVAATERIVEVRAREVSVGELERRCATAGRQPQGEAFERALRTSAAPRVIAECKRRSPSRGILRHDYDPAAHARSYAAAGAAAISVLTEPTFFDGALEHLEGARAAVSVPLLRKDFVISRYQLLEAAAAGADAALLIVAALDDRTLRQLLDDAHALGLACLVEVHDTTEIARARPMPVPASSASTAAICGRWPSTWTCSIARRRCCPPASPPLPRAASSRPADIARLSAAGYHAFLVGERLITQPDPGAALRVLRGGDVK